MAKTSFISVCRRVLARVRTPRAPERAAQEVLNRLSPSVFSGLLDVDGKLLYANHAALQAIGSKPEQVLGQRFEATPWWQGCASSRRQLQLALVSAARGEASRFDVRIATRSGESLLMDFSLLPLYGPDGQVVYLIASACDVSEREQAAPVAAHTPRRRAGQRRIVAGRA